MLSSLLTRLLEGHPLDRESARTAMGHLVEGEATPAQTGAFLAALKVRGETLDELVGFALALRERVTPVHIRRKPLLDTCGTGGDGSGTFNISTAVAFIAAGGGAAVAKHGNRSVSSRCGSADVLEALGVKTQITAEKAARCVEEAGIGFLFAPAYHPAMKHVAPARKELGVRTVFNLLGPLSNPARAARQLLGVYDHTKTELMAQALHALGSEEALVVSSHDGLDEMSLGAKTVVAHLKDGKVKSYEVDAHEYGLKRRALSELAGGDAQANAKILHGVLSGLEGAAREVCVWNAAAAFLAAGLVTDLKEGLERASASLDTKRALKALEDLKRLSND